MTDSPFDADEWIDRLGASLDALAADVKFSFSSDDGQGPYLTLDQIRAHHEQAGRSSRIPGSMVPSGVQWTGNLDEQRAILRDHPVLRRALNGTGEEESLLLLMPMQGALISSHDLVLSLLRRTAKSSGQETARLLHRYLTDGEARQLEAREFVVLYGLKLTGRIDLGSGSFLALLDDRFLSEEGFGEFEADRLTSFGADRRDFQTDTGGSSVLVRDLTWGPGIAPVSGARNTDTAKISHAFPIDVETVVNLLSIASRSPLATSGRYLRAAGWMHEIHANFRFGHLTSTSYPLDGWCEERALTSEAEDRFKRLVAGWAGFQFASAMERDALTLAAWRLSGSFTRIGRWELQDRLLDYAIALEILYRPGKSEVTYTLGTRAAWLLGKKPEQRRTVFDKITRFYGVRSVIVHGSTTKKGKKGRLEDVDQACADGRELACDSLLELLQLGRFPDWKGLVLDAPAESTGHPPPGPAVQAGG